MTDKAILLDLDGTVYNGDTLTRGAKEAIHNMRKQGLKVLFCTNNSSKMPSYLSNKLNKLGISCTTQDIVSSGMMAINYVKNNDVGNVYVSGSNDLKKEFTNAGIFTCLPNEADTIIIGMDSDFNYNKLTESVRAAIIAKKIILCNEDRVFLKDNELYPGCGGMTSSILHCSHKKPDVIVGKPSTFMLEYIAKSTGLSSEKMLIIGDSYESDIIMAQKYGCKSLWISPGTEEMNAISGLEDTIKWEWSKIF